MQAPDAGGLQQLVEPVGKQLMAASGMADNRRSAVFNHLKTAADALQALTWVVYSGPSCGESSVLGVVGRT